MNINEYLWHKTDDIENDDISITINRFNGIQKYKEFWWLKKINNNQFYVSHIFNFSPKFRTLYNIDDLEAYMRNDFKKWLNGELNINNKIY